MSVETPASQAPKWNQDAPLLLDVQRVAQLLGVSPRHVWRVVDSGHFPAPISMGGKLKRWSLQEVQDWIVDQAARRPKARLA